jgi:hypothetical protein
LSESGKTKKLRLNPPSATSRSGTPQGSRAASPVAGTQFPGSRAASPDGTRGECYPMINLYDRNSVCDLYNILTTCKQAPAAPPQSHPANHSPHPPRSTPRSQLPELQVPPSCAFSVPALESPGRIIVVSLLSSRMWVCMARRISCCGLVPGGQPKLSGVGEELFHW